MSALWKRVTVLATVAGLILLIVFLYLEKPAGSFSQIKEIRAPTPQPAAPDSPPGAIGKGSPLATRINSSAQTPAEDLKIVYSLIQEYIFFLQNRQGPPIGDNLDLVKALTGHNPLHLVFLPQNHPAISPQGQLFDRWGTPYFIHPLGSRNYEIRSAGPDKKLFTADDLDINPPPPRL